jgi:pimeloyl-ACP methyl ester carboxylesterase
MPAARITSATGPIELHYEETGEGFPLIWCHEFGGDHRSWEAQVRYFCRRYRMITWNYRGYPPSDVPTDPDAYSVEILVEDLRRLMEHAASGEATVRWVGMGRMAHLGRRQAACQGPPPASLHRGAAPSSLREMHRASRLPPTSA